MRKVKRYIVVFVILLIVCVLYTYNHKQKTINQTRVGKDGDIGEIVEIKIIDKYNNMEKIYKNSQLEEFVLVDAIIDGQYYHSVGIRTKGSYIYSHLRKYKSTRYSYKLKLDYMDKEQQYKGMPELHLNTNVSDKTVFREYLVYKAYNKMGVQTQCYGLGDLTIGDKHVGLITLIEVVNENYINNAYNSTGGNLYKPQNQEASLIYKNDEFNMYKGIFDYTRTAHTTVQDKKRLIEILKKIKEAKTPEEVEANFIDWDKVIKCAAINKGLANVDNFIGGTIRNFYLYEKDGKIDIIPYDFNMSLGSYIDELAFSVSQVNDIELTEYRISLHSIIVDLIVKNPEFLERYRQYVRESVKVIETMKAEGKIDEIANAVEDIIKATENEFYTYETHKQDVEALKQFIDNRVIMMEDPELFNYNYIINAKPNVW